MTKPSKDRNQDIYDELAQHELPKYRLNLKIYFQQWWWAIKKPHRLKNFRPKSKFGYFLQRVLKAGREPRQYQKPRPTRLEELLRHSNDLNLIRELASYILYNNGEVSKVIATWMIPLLQNLNTKQLLYLNQHLRGYYNSYDINTATGTTPKEVIQFITKLGGHPLLFGLMSMGGNGYYREAALRKLATTDATLAIPFFLLRLEDHVSQIRKFAAKCVQENLKTEYVEVFFDSILLRKAVRLGEVERAKSVWDKIDPLLLQEPENLEYGLTHPSIAVRKESIALGLQYKALSTEQLHRLAESDQDPIIRNQTVALLCQMGEGIESLYQKFHDDTSANIRQSVLQAAYQENQKQEILWPALVDANSHLRVFASYYLRQEGVTEEGLLVYIRNALQQKAPRGAILALVELGGPEDYELIQPFLQHKSRKARNAALRGAVKFQPPELVSMLMQELKENKSGRALAVRFIKQNHAEFDTEMLWQLFVEAKEEGLKLNLIGIFYKRPFWEALYYLLLIFQKEEYHVLIRPKIQMLQAGNRNICAPAPKEIEGKIRELVTSQAAKLDQGSYGFGVLSKELLFLLGAE